MYTILSIDEIRGRLFDRNLSIVSRETQVSRTTIYKIMKGSVPSYETVVKLSKYLQERK